MFYETRAHALGAALRRTGIGVGVDELIQAARDAKVSLPVEAITGYSPSISRSGQTGRLVFRIVEDRLPELAATVDKLIYKSK